jgi:hypothetical protein
MSIPCSYHVPDIRIVTCEPLRIGEECQLIIKLCNPTQHQSAIQFLPLPSAEEDLEEREKEIEEKKKKQAEKKNAEVTKITKLDTASLLLSQIDRILLTVRYFI